MRKQHPPEENPKPSTITVRHSQTQNTKNHPRKACKPRQTSAETNQRILIMAAIGLMGFGVVERLFVKDEVVFTVVSSIFSGIIGHFFRPPKNQA